MKKAEDLIIGCEHDGSYIPVNEVLKLIKLAQIDTIEEMCRVCADELYTKQIPYFDGTDLEKTNCSEIWEEDCFVPSYLSVIDKQSILSVADKLKKELE